MSRFFLYEANGGKDVAVTDELTAQTLSEELTIFWPLTVTAKENSSKHELSLSDKLVKCLFVVVPAQTKEL